jgi:structural maintenance of chromosome 2
VTLEGDVYDPSGTISGGSNDKLGTTLSNLSELDESNVQLQEKMTRLEQVNSKLAPLHSVAAKYEKLKADLELADAALQSASKNLSQTSYGMLAEKRDGMAIELEAAKQEISDMTKEQEEKWQLFQDLQTQKDALTQQREHRLAEIEQAVKDAKTDAVKKSKLAREVRAILCY